MEDGVVLVLSPALNIFSLWLLSGSGSLLAWPGSDGSSRGQDGGCPIRASTAESILQVLQRSSLSLRAKKS